MHSLHHSVEGFIVHISFANNFLKILRFVRMASLKISMLNFANAVGNIYSQFPPINRGPNFAY